MALAFGMGKFPVNIVNKIFNQNRLSLAFMGCQIVNVPEFIDCSHKSMALKGGDFQHIGIICLVEKAVISI